MPARSAAKTAVPNAYGGPRGSVRHLRISCAEPITEAQIAEFAKHIPPGAARPFVPMALAALIQIAKSGKDPSARRDAAEVLSDFYSSPWGRMFAPKSTVEAARAERLGETKTN